MTLFLTREQIVSWKDLLTLLKCTREMISNNYLSLLQIECTGVQHFEQLIEMEILFNSFDEFASLEGCTNLRRLSCKNNYAMHFWYQTTLPHHSVP